MFFFPIKSKYYMFLDSMIDVIIISKCQLLKKECTLCLVWNCQDASGSKCLTICKFKIHARFAALTLFSELQPWRLFNLNKNYLCCLRISAFKMILWRPLKEKRMEVYLNVCDLKSLLLNKTPVNTCYHCNIFINNS